MEADHGPAGHLSGRGHREAHVVCGAMEDRDLSQDPEIGVQGGGRQAQNRRASAAAARGLLCPELADFLDDDDQPIRLPRAGGGRLHDHRAVGCSITWCRIATQTAREGNPFPRTSPKWPGSAAILPARVILRLATSSCGEGSPDSPISNWDLAWRSLWVIER